MKKILLLVSLFYISSLFAQSKQNPLVILDSKKIGFVQDLKKEMDAINPQDISKVTVLKDTIISKKYGSNFGVIIITTKKYILDTFFENFIKNSSIKEKIKSPEDLLKIGVISDKRESKNQPYDELSKYIFTNTINEKIKKISSIFFIDTENALKINPKWENGAIEINSEGE